ncbi:MAG: hypothetical protein QNM02_10330, partial [Acidimicrobiia bacterium]|nr:hypothetical protein [Acidimicrobiia bacterium]
LEKASGGMGGGLGGGSCTPGYYNNEGQSLGAPPYTAPYGGGSIKFFELMDEWRSTGDYEGLEFTD